MTSPQCTEKRNPPLGRNVPQLPIVLWSMILEYKTEAYIQNALDHCEFIGICPCVNCGKVGKIYGYPFMNEFCEAVLCPVCDLDAPTECGGRCICGSYDNDDSFVNPIRYM
jgi:hypothetical protein